MRGEDIVPGVQVRVWMEWDGNSSTLLCITFFQRRRESSDSTTLVTTIVLRLTGRGFLSSIGGFVGVRVRE